MSDLPSGGRRGPSFAPEQAFGRRRVAGIDEAGRGPWAGPVVAAAVIFDGSNAPADINDSKKLTSWRRESLFEQIMADALAVGVGMASVEEIDRLNILRATDLAVQRAVVALAVTPEIVLVDGNHPPPLPCTVATLVGGDALSLSVAAASIIAKVTRDRLMCNLAAQHPHYGWATNMGYGTPGHQAALAEHGPCHHHRRSFAPIARLLSGALDRGAEFYPQAESFAQQALNLESSPRDRLNG